MIVTLVHVWVKPEKTKEFIEASIENHQESVKEPGNLRFDFLRDAQDENKFVLYEAYESESAALLHKDTAHYKKWRDRVADMMAQPRRGEKHIILSPTDKNLW
ncbi:MAG: antibiotic biosynthesis monooxygenase [Bacteroidales bacterium]|nr:antibiotic biosynthesis monooxygenase [Bacteroidales bacterium]